MTAASTFRRAAVEEVQNRKLCPMCKKVQHKNNSHYVKWTSGKARCKPLQVSLNLQLYVLTIARFKFELDLTAVIFGRLLFFGEQYFEKLVNAKAMLWSE